MQKAKELELKYNSEFPSEFNVLIRKFEDCPQKKSDSGNGYYIVSDVWGTCFHRIAKNKDRFEVKYVSNRSYTKIPVSAVENTYHVVVNYKNAAFKISPQGGDERYRVVGIHEPIRHNSKDYYTQSFIVYSKAQFSIEQIAVEGVHGLWIQNKDGLYVRPKSLLPFDMNYIKPF